MDFDTRGFIQKNQTSDLVTETQPELTGGEAYDFATMVAQNERTDSESLYAAKFVDKQLDELMSLDPANKKSYEKYKAFGHTQRYIIEDMLDVGVTKGLFRGRGFFDTFFNIGNVLNTPVYSAMTGGANPVELANLVSKKRQEFGLDDLKTLRSNSMLQAKEDYNKGQEALKNVDFFSSAGFGQLRAGFVQSMSDPATQMEIISTLGVGAEAMMMKSGLSKVAHAAGIGAGTAFVSEVPIQTMAYDWKNRVDIDWSVKDAFIQGAFGIATGGAILGGSKALFDVLPKKVKSMKASRDKFKAETAHRADTLVTGSAVKDINAHIEILQAVRMAKETGQQFDVVKAFGLKAEKTEVGKIFTEAELSGSKSFIDHVNDNFEEQLQDPRVLHMTDKNEVPSPEYKHDINYDELDKYGIGNTGKNPLEEAKMQKVNDWAAQLTEDVGVPVRRVDMEGNEIIEIKSLKDTVLEYNNDIEGMNKLMECGNV